MKYGSYFKIVKKVKNNMDISDMCKWNNNDKDQGEPQNKNFIIKCYNIKFTSQNITATEKKRKFT